LRFGRRVPVNTGEVVHYAGNIEGWNRSCRSYHAASVV
jgi:hypothetical protein